MIRRSYQALIGNRLALRNVPVFVVMIGVGGLIWIAMSWLFPRLVELQPVDETTVEIFFFGGFLGIPSALVGAHLRIEWYLVMRRTLAEDNAVLTEPHDGA